MIPALIVLAALALAYDQYVRWQMRQPIEQKYNHVLANVLRLLTGGRMKCTSLWRRAWLLWNPVDPANRLSTGGEVHEFDGHIRNPEQWAGHPRLFPVLYLIELARHGYDECFWEEQARYIAGEALRSTGKQRERVDAWVKVYRAKHPVAA